MSPWHTLVTTSGTATQLPLPLEFIDLTERRGDAMPLEILSTVPATVRAIASSAEALDELTEGDPELGQRLVTYPDMAATWAILAQHNDPELPALYFMAAAELPTRWRKMPKTRSAKLRRDVVALAGMADRLAKSLDKLDGEITFHRGWPLTFHHVMVRSRSIKREIIDKSATPDPWSYALRADDHGAYPILSDFVRALGAELRPSGVPRNARIRPTKVLDRNVERTFMVRSLSVFLHGAFGNPRVDLVTPTVNTVLDERTNPLDENHARKLLTGLF